MDTRSTRQNGDDHIVTPSEEMDVTQQSNQEPEQEEVQNDVEEQNTESSSTGSDYDEAWKNIDIDNPPDSIFGSTTEFEEPAEQPKVEEPVVPEETQVEAKTGLVISNPVLKYKGKEIPIDSEEELIALAQKGFKLESEMTKIKPQKQILNIVDGVPAEDLKAFADAKSGDKAAIGYVLNMLGGSSEGQADDFWGAEPQREEEKKAYTPDIPQVDEVAEIFKDITENNPSVAGTVSEVYSELDDQFKQEVYNPQTFPAFVKSVESGEFDKVYPIAMKLRTQNPALTWLQAYGLAGQRVLGGKQEVQKETPPKSTSIPKQGTSERKLDKLDYDAAYDLSLDELEQRIFS